MPFIDLKKMPKSKQRIIVIQASVIFVIIVAPLVFFTSFIVVKDFVLSPKDKSKNGTVDIKKNNIKEIKSVFNITAEVKDGWGATLITGYGKKQEANRQVYFTLGNAFNSINVKINEVKKVETKPVDGQLTNGLQNDELIEINDISSAVIIHDDLAGQKIARIANPKEPTSYLLINLNSKKLGEKDLKAKTPEPDKFFYNSKLNLFPDLSKELTDRDFLVSIQGNINKAEEMKDVDDIIKSLKVTN
jgi:hypothetical protein